MSKSSIYKILSKEQNTLDNFLNKQSAKDLSWLKDEQFWILLTMIAFDKKSSLNALTTLGISIDYLSINRSLNSHEASSNSSSTHSASSFLSRQATSRYQYQFTLDNSCLRMCSMISVLTCCGHLFRESRSTVRSVFSLPINQPTYWSTLY